MTPVRVAIIGGGLAGLSAAAQLAAVGITDYVLLEARDRLGGRILSVSADGVDGRGARLPIRSAMIVVASSGRIARLPTPSRPRCFVLNRASESPRSG